MRFACWIHKAIDTHLELLIFITFPLQQRLRECTLVLRYVYTVCFVGIKSGQFISAFAPDYCVLKGIVPLRSITDLLIIDDFEVKYKCFHFHLSYITNPLIWAIYKSFLDIWQILIE
jgi:hypothetical protein